MMLKPYVKLRSRVLKAFFESDHINIPPVHLS